MAPLAIQLSARLGSRDQDPGMHPALEPSEPMIEKRAGLPYAAFPTMLDTAGKTARKQYPASTTNFRSDKINSTDIIHNDGDFRGSRSPIIYCAEGFGDARDATDARGETVKPYFSPGRRAEDADSAPRPYSDCWSTIAIAPTAAPAAAAATATPGGGRFSRCTSGVDDGMRLPTDYWGSSESCEGEDSGGGGGDKGRGSSLYNGLDKGRDKGLDERFDKGHRRYGCSVDGEGSSFGSIIQERSSAARIAISAWNLSFIAKRSRWCSCDCLPLPRGRRGPSRNGDRSPETERGAGAGPPRVFPDGSDGGRADTSRPRHHRREHSKGSISQHHSLAPKTAHIVDQPRGWEDRSSSANGSTVAISTITTTTASSSTNSSNVSAALAAAAAASASYGFDGISSLHDGGGGTGTGKNNGGAAVVVTRSSNFATININNDISVSSSGVSRSNGSGGVGRLLSGGRRSDSLGGANGVDRDFHRIMKAGVVVFKHSSTKEAGHWSDVLPKRIMAMWSGTCPLKDENGGLVTLFLDREKNRICWCPPGAAKLVPDERYCLEVEGLAAGFIPGDKLRPRLLSLRTSGRPNPLVIEADSDELYDILCRGIARILERNQIRDALRTTELLPPTVVPF